MAPERWALMAWQAGAVFTLRSLQLWNEPLHATSRLVGHAAEKQRAAMQGMVHLAEAVARGATPAAMMAAALEPARRRVAANARGLARKRRR